MRGDKSKRKSRGSKIVRRSSSAGKTAPAAVLAAKDGHAKYFGDDNGANSVTELSDLEVAEYGRVVMGDDDVFRPTVDISEGDVHRHVVGEGGGWNIPIHLPSHYNLDSEAAVHMFEDPNVDEEFIEEMINYGASPHRATSPSLNRHEPIYSRGTDPEAMNESQMMDPRFAHTPVARRVSEDVPADEDEEGH